MIIACLATSTPPACAPSGAFAVENAPRGARWLTAWLMAMIASLIVASPALAQEPPSGSVSRQSREEALRSIPFDQLNAEAKHKIGYVVSNPSIFRRLPTKTIECDPEMYLFLVRYPEVVINIWDIMGVTSVSMERNGPYTYSANDGLGTVSDVELVYGNANTHLLFASGAYDGQGPLLRSPVKANCVMLLQSSFSKTPDDRVVVTSQLDVFVRIESTGIDLLAKTLHPLLGRTADINFVESTKFLGRLSAAAETNGPGVSELAQKLEKVHPEVRAKFASVAENVHQRALLRMAEQSLGMSNATQPATTELLKVATRKEQDDSMPQ